jgi:predicted Fe-Mo cluster-binding NifX family protein
LLAENIDAMSTAQFHTNRLTRKLEVKAEQFAQGLDLFFCFHCLTGARTMDVKIAFASSDGKTVNEHFGRSPGFYIYRLHDSGHELVERRERIPVCSGQAHDDDALANTAEALSDCRGVVAAQIGAGAIDALLMFRIMAFTLPGSIEEAIEALIRAKRFAYLK